MFIYIVPRQRGKKGKGKACSLQYFGNDLKESVIFRGEMLVQAKEPVKNLCF